MFKEKINLTDNTRTVQFDKLYNYDIVVTPEEYDELKSDESLTQELRDSIDIYTQDITGITLRIFKKNRNAIHEAIAEIRSRKKASPQYITPVTSSEGVLAAEA